MAAAALKHHVSLQERPQKSRGALVASTGARGSARLALCSGGGKYFQPLA